MICGKDLMFKTKIPKNQAGLYEKENISNINTIAVGISTKECFEKYIDYPINKNFKGVIKNTPGIDFNTFSERLAALHEYCFDWDHKPKKLEQKRF